MQKMQILFPEPMMARMRSLAEAEDRPVSEIVRRAVERLLEQSPSKGRRTDSERLPTFRAGRVRVSAGEMKSLLYDE
jgi:Arc/MetJ-type ribon-helix-helix transcriptional regulator